MITRAIFPARYIQVATAPGERAAHTNILGSRALVVLGPGIADWSRPGECIFDEPTACGGADYLAAMKTVDAHGRAFGARQYRKIGR